MQIKFSVFRNFKHENSLKNLHVLWWDFCLFVVLGGFCVVWFGVFKNYSECCTFCCQGYNFSVIYIKEDKSEF